MAIPQQAQGVWERKYGEGGVVRQPAPWTRRRFTQSAPWFGIIAIIVLFLYAMARSMLSIFTGKVPAAFHLSLCSSTSVGTRLGSDLLSAFLIRSGGGDVRITNDGALTKVTARLPG